MEKLRYFVPKAYYTFTNKNMLLLLKSRILQCVILSGVLVSLNLPYFDANFTLKPGCNGLVMALSVLSLISL
jgi:hypothetical protein